MKMDAASTMWKSYYWEKRGNIVWQQEKFIEINL